MFYVIASPESLKIFFGVLTIVLVIYLVARVVQTSFEGLTPERTRADESDLASEPLLISQMTTLGIVVLGGKFTLDRLSVLIFSLGGLRQEVWHSLNLYIFIVQFLGLFAGIALILFAPVVTRLISRRCSSWPGDHPVFRKMITVILMSFSGWIVMTKLPAFAVGIYQVSGTVMDLAWKMLGQQQHLSFLELIGIKEIRFMKIMLLAGMAIVMVRYRQWISRALEQWYGGIYGCE